jgi:site-specific recombinase XerD
MEGFNWSAEDFEKLRVMISLMGQVEVVTLRVFTEEYKNLIKHNRSRSYYKSVETALNYLNDYFGEQRAMNSIALKEIETFLMHLQKKGEADNKRIRSGNGYRVYYRNLRAAFNKALEWKYLKENYFLKVKLPRRQRLNPSFISEEELKIITAHVEVSIVKDFVTAAFYTGMRLNELVNLTWKNVDLNGKLITVGDENFETKGKNQRYIPISDEVLNILKNLLPEPPFVMSINSKGFNEGFVFCKRGGEKFTGDYFSKRFKRACKAAGMDKGIHFHTLRHSFASNLAQRGVSLYTIKELLGHTSISTTEIYSHLNVDTLKEAMKVFDPHYYETKIKS